MLEIAGGIALFVIGLALFRLIIRAAWAIIVHFLEQRPSRNSEYRSRLYAKANNDNS